MADDKSKRGGADRTRVSKMEDYEVKYLAQKHGTTQKAVKDAVDRVGNARNKVEAELKASNKAAADAKAAKAAAKTAAKTSSPAKQGPVAKGAATNAKRVAAKKGAVSDATGEHAGDAP